MINIKCFRAWYNKKNPIIENGFLNIENGEIIALLGRNGAGKTTLLNSIVGLHHSWEGEIKLRGRNLTNKNEIENKRNIYYISDGVELLEELTPREFINFIHDVYNKELDKDRINYYVDVFSFKECVDEKIKNLSLGNKQKVALITGFLIEAPLFILDEPLVGLDIMAIEVFYKEAKNYVKDGKSILFSTHIIDIIQNIGDKVYVLDRGKIEGPFPIKKNLDLRQMFFKVIENE